MTAQPWDYSRGANPMNAGLPVGPDNRPMLPSMQIGPQVDEKKRQDLAKILMGGGGYGGGALGVGMGIGGGIKGLTTIGLLKGLFGGD